MKPSRSAFLAAVLVAAALSSCTLSTSGNQPDGAAGYEDPASGQGDPTSAPLDAPSGERAAPDGTDAWPKGDAGIPDATETAPPASDGPILAPTRVSGTAKCQELAKGPWHKVEHGPDPLARVREGLVPALPDGEDSPPDYLSEFTTLDSYRDPSTLEDPGMVHDAWEQAGFKQGVEARWGHGPSYTAITVVQFRDAASAQDAMTAHLTDLCRRTTQASVRDNSNGLLLTRDSEAVRSVYVMDDIEVSVFTCSCYWDTVEHREEGIHTWAFQTELALNDPTANTGTS